MYNDIYIYIYIYIYIIIIDIIIPMIFYYEVKFILKNAKNAVNFSTNENYIYIFNTISI